jgi:hypothetical protein
MKHLFYNSIHCNLCEENIQSYYRHDFKYCKCGNAMVDGGLAYVRYGYREDPDTITHFYMFIEDHPFSIIRQYYYRWNTRIGEYVLLKDIDDEWLQAILDYYILPKDNYAYMEDEYLLLFLMEKQYRLQNEE